MRTISKNLPPFRKFLTIAAFIIFFAPTFGGWFLEHDNFTPANNLVTPSHIKPSWYFTPFYAILRMIPSFFGTAIWGVIGNLTHSNTMIEWENDTLWTAAPSAADELFADEFNPFD